MKNEKCVDVFQGKKKESPIVILNSFSRSEGSQVNHLLRQMTDRDFHLVSVSNLRWDDDMTPWPIPPIAPGDTPCGGKADTYLKELLDEIIPRVKRQLGVKQVPVWLTGYSLAGLFAVYAMYCTDAFSRIASVSGSLWYPDLMDFMKNHRMIGKPECAYFSLGDQEAHTDNEFLKPVQENTDRIQRYFGMEGTASVFELNRGNHYQNAEERMARGIRWILEENPLAEG